MNSTVEKRGQGGLKNRRMKTSREKRMGGADVRGVKKICSTIISDI